MSGTCVARTTPIPSQRARGSSVGKTPSFSFCQVDMYAIYLFDAMLPRHYIVRKGIATVMHWDLDLFRCQNIGLTSSV